MAFAGLLLAVREVEKQTGRVMAMVAAQAFFQWSYGVEPVGTDQL